MIKLKKTICLALVSISLSGIFASCYDRREVDDLAYVIAIGIDKGKTNTLRMTLQLAVPKTIGGGEGGGGGGEEAMTLITVETPTLYSGLNMANNTISRQLNISHTKLMVFSKEYAEQGIENIMTALPRGREVRPALQIAITRGSAEDFMKVVKPKLEVNPAKYYDLMFQSYKHTGFTARTDFFKFYTHLKSLHIEPVAVLAGVGKYKSSDEFSIEDSTAPDKERNQPLEGDFKAGNIPEVGDVKTEIMGLAVFKHGKMVGELDGEETTFYNMVNGDFQRSYITIQDPIEKDKFVILDTKQSRRPQQKVNIKDGKPEIQVKIRLEADIQVIQSGRNYEDTKNMHILENEYEKFLRTGINKMLYKTSREYESDICGFGQYIKAKFLTLGEWKDYKWLDKYKDSTFNVEVDLKIRRPGLTIRSSPEKQ